MKISSGLPVIIIVEHVRSSYNIGSLFRSAAALGVEQIIFSPQCPVPPRLDITKTALGGEKSVPWVQVDSLTEKIRQLQSSGYTVAALEQTPKSTSLFTTAMHFPIALVIGHEREGVSQETLALCNLHLELPMVEGPVHSLNVTQAATVALYEIARRVWYNVSN